MENFAAEIYADITESATCKSCGKPYAEHLGLTGTCAALQRHAEAMRRVWDAYDCHTDDSEPMDRRWCEKAGFEKGYKDDVPFWFFDHGPFRIIYGLNGLGLIVEDRHDAAHATVKENPTRRDARLLAVGLGFKIGKK